MSELLRQHGAHAIVLGGPLLVMAAMLLLLRHGDPARERRAATSSLLPLSLCWWASGVIHLLVIGEHFEQAAALGVFFLVLAAVQLSYALMIAKRASRQLLLLGLLTNVAVIALWTWTRTVDVPFGLGAREPVGAVDLASTALEAAAVLLAGQALHRSARSRQQRASATPRSRLSPAR